MGLNLTALALTLFIVLLAAVALAGVVLVPALLGTIGLGETMSWLITLLCWPAIALVFIVALAALYRFAPSLIDSGVAYRLHGWPLLLMADMRRMVFLDHGVPLIDNGYPEFAPDAPHPVTPDGSMH